MQNKSQENLSFLYIGESQEWVYTKVTLRYLPLLSPEPQPGL